MKKGFTLIELLAVIVILAIIALIATPIVLNIIDDSKESSMIRSAEGYLRAVEYEVARAYVTANRITEGTYYVLPGGDICIDGYTNNTCSGNILEIEYNNEGPIGGTITLEQAEIIHYALTYPNDVLIVDGKIRDLEEIPEPKSFGEDSWSTIAANVRAGNLSKYNVGDTKEIALDGYTNNEKNSNGLYTIRIANTSTPSECNGANFSQTVCGFVIEFVDIITRQHMNSSDEFVGGWPASEMRQFVTPVDGVEGSGTIYNALPYELRENIIETRVVSGYELGKTSNYISIDKLYLLSTKEIYGTAITGDKVVNETRQLDYYKNYKNEDGSVGVTSSKYEGAIKNLDGSPAYWWLRSANSDIDAPLLYSVNYDGEWEDASAGDNDGVAVAFRL